MAWFRADAARLGYIKANGRGFTEYCRAHGITPPHDADDEKRKEGKLLPLLDSDVLPSGQRTGWQLGMDGTEMEVDL